MQGDKEAEYDAGVKYSQNDISWIACNEAIGPEMLEKRLTTKTTNDTALDP